MKWNSNIALTEQADKSCSFNNNWNKFSTHDTQSPSCVKWNVYFWRRNYNQFLKEVKLSERIDRLQSGCLIGWAMCVCLRDGEMNEQIQLYWLTAYLIKVRSLEDQINCFLSDWAINLKKSFLLKLESNLSGFCRLNRLKFELEILSSKESFPLLALRL